MAHLQETPTEAGVMQWGRNDGKITELYVKRAHRRQGVATGMMNEARRVARENSAVVEPQHHSLRSRAGDAWAKKIGGYVPPLDKDGYMTYEDEE
jgi:GNAT superfamily N-acetyltransferase